MIWKGLYDTSMCRYVLIYDTPIILTVNRIITWGNQACNDCTFHLAEHNYDYIWPLIHFVEIPSFTFRNRPSLVQLH